MFGFTILLAVGVTLARACAPPYVQSREAFTHARTYVSEFLAPQIGDIHNAAARQHFSFGILAKVVAGLVTTNKLNPGYHPLNVVDEEVPYAWRNYKEISQKGQKLLNMASEKVDVIGVLIDNLCGAESVRVCNNKVHSEILSAPNIYQRPAELQLLLGKASETLRHLEPTINSVTEERKEIPYLIKNIDSYDFNAFIADLEEFYNTMTNSLVRRNNSTGDIIVNASVANIKSNGK